MDLSRQLDDQAVTLATCRMIGHDFAASNYASLPTPCLRCGYKPTNSPLFDELGIKPLLPDDYYTINIRIP